MNRFIVNGILVAMLGHLTYAQGTEATPEEEVIIDGPMAAFDGKCIECLFSNKHNFYCPETSNCIQSTTDKFGVACGMTNAEPLSLYTNHVGRCLEEPINEVIETKCAQQGLTTTNLPGVDADEWERGDTWIIVSSPSEDLEKSNTIFHNLDRRLDEEAELGDEPARVYP